MPFKKLGHGEYEGPSGKKFNLAQVRLYYHGNGFPGQKEKGMAEGGLVTKETSVTLGKDAGGVPDLRQEYTARPCDAPLTKGSAPTAAEFAKGGAVLQEKRSRFSKFGGADIEAAPMMFMRQKDPFRTDAGRQDYEKTSPGGEMSRETGDKSETPIKPRT